MILDSHMHLMGGTGTRDAFNAGLQAAGVAGGIVLSRPPACFTELASPMPAAERLVEVLAWCAGAPDRYPFYWIDPLEEDAEAQVAWAVAEGIAGFKIICDRFYPSDPRALAVARAAAGLNKPILFHSGILWDGKPSSRYNRPVEFEALLEVPGLSFALAHISWPWCDELLAVYGKFAAAHRANTALTVTMYIDTTPGTPPIYRREALQKLLTIGYDLERNILFGSDCVCEQYNPDSIRDLIADDRAIYTDLGATDTQLQCIFAENLRRFVGVAG